MVEPPRLGLLPESPGRRLQTLVARPARLTARNRCRDSPRPVLRTVSTKFKRPECLRIRAV